MNRKEAQALVGHHVSAWTSMHGTYAGTLEELVVSPGRPWRAKVRITGVLSPAACTWDRAGRQRWGYRVGDLLEVGGSSIRPDASCVRSYLDALQQDLTTWEGRVGTVGPKDLALAQFMIRELGLLIAQEPERLAQKLRDREAPSAPVKDRFDRTLTEGELAKVLETVNGTPTTMTQTLQGIAPTKIKVTAFLNGDKVIAAFVGGGPHIYQLTDSEIADLEA